MRDYKIEFLCPMCYGLHNISVEFSDYIKYRESNSNLDLISVLFPYLNATERKQIHEHYCPNCQKNFL